MFGEFFARLCSQFISGLAEAGQKIVVLAMKLLVVGGQRVGMVVCPVLEAAYVRHLAGLCDTGPGKVAEFFKLVDVLLLKIG